MDGLLWEKEMLNASCSGTKKFKWAGSIGRNEFKGPVGHARKEFSRASCLWEKGFKMVCGHWEK